MHPCLLTLSVLASIASAAGAPAPMDMFDGHAVRSGAVNCTHEAPHAPAAVAGQAPPPQRFMLFPLAGVRYEDLWINNFVDLNPGAGALDWDCDVYTYNGHRGNDTDLRGFAEQEIGVPVFAALDGQVLTATDGNADHNTSCIGIANSVQLLHDGGVQTWYWHLRNGSVSVNAGDTVRAGQQIGLAASSGCSTQPHLHFEVRQAGLTIEPFTGACNAGESWWEEQLPIDRGFYIRDLGVTREHAGAATGWPWPLPVGGQIAQSDNSIWVWFVSHNLPPFSDRRWEFERPDGSIAVSVGPNSFGNPSLYRIWWGRFVFNNVPGVSTTPGVWHVRLYINEELAVRAPFEVVPAFDPLLNHPPEPIGVTLSPDPPASSQVLIAQVHNDLVVDDRDYDVVRYQYTWTVNNAVVRDVTSAARSDALSYIHSVAGDTVRCTVTPSDGKESGRSVVASVAVAADADLNGDGAVNGVDLAVLLSSWGDCPQGFPCHADFNDDGVVGGIDLAFLLSAWTP